MLAAAHSLAHRVPQVVDGDGQAPMGKADAFGLSAHRLHKSVRHVRGIFLALGCKDGDVNGP
jgi:hypothetical protein